jgi:hypothetical protein
MIIDPFNTRHLWFQLETVILKALHSGGSTIGNVCKVELLGSDIKLNWIHTIEIKNDGAGKIALDALTII